MFLDTKSDVIHVNNVKKYALIDFIQVTRAGFHMQTLLGSIKWLTERLDISVHSQLKYHKNIFFS